MQRLGRVEARANSQRLPARKLMLELDHTGLQALSVGQIAGPERLHLSSQLRIHSKSNSCNSMDFARGADPSFALAMTALSFHKFTRKTSFS